MMPCGMQSLALCCTALRTPGPGHIVKIKPGRVTALERQRGLRLLNLLSLRPVAALLLPPESVFGVVHAGMCMCKDSHPRTVFIMVVLPYRPDIAAFFASCCVSAPRQKSGPARTPHLAWYAPPPGSLGQQQWRRESSEASFRSFRSLSRLERLAWSEGSRSRCRSSTGVLKRVNHDKWIA